MLQILYDTLYFILAAIGYERRDKRLQVKEGTEIWEPAQALAHPFRALPQEYLAHATDMSLQIIVSRRSLFKGCALLLREGLK